MFWRWTPAIHAERMLLASAAVAAAGSRRTMLAEAQDAVAGL